jgi:hypothetical protein
LPCCPLRSSSPAVLSPSGCWPPPAWWLSLGSSPVFAFAPDWWSLRVAAVMGGGVAVVVRSVLLGVGHSVVLLVERSLVLVKLKEKITHERDQEVTPPSPAACLPFGPPPSPSFLCRLAAALVAVAALVSSWWWRFFLSMLHLPSPSCHRGSRSCSVGRVCL